MDYFNITPEEKLEGYQSHGNSFMQYSALDPVTPTPLGGNPIPMEEGFLSDYVNKKQDNYLKKVKPLKKVQPIVSVGEDLEYSQQDMSSIIASYNKKNMALDLTPKKSKAPVKNLDFNLFESEIRRKESDGIATADNPNSSAVGYYQFLWGSWGKDIARVTGVKTSDEFKKRPDMQKKFFKFYYENYITPAVIRIKSKLGGKVELEDFDIAQLIHFRGEGGARKVLSNGELHKKHEGYNPTPLQYINN